MKYIYEVKENENLKDICAKYFADCNQVLKDNFIKEENIRPGLLLLIQVKDGERYVVKPFDTLEKIANNFGVSQDDIKNYNNIKQVFLGQIIYLPPQ